ncbi:hypothetical protein SH661x_000302 [Planctomicrobium sp. SH661]|uniref:hypothetical protein n=1 Tax=Planctomicrobium sp. SH661 TaxID=3448124 RepID=UPI003F5C30AC
MSATSAKDPKEVVIQLGQTTAKSCVVRIGVGEIFVVAGQSNTANWGEKRLAPQLDRVFNWV